MALQDPQAEPSMEEILASIRRIISEEDEAPAEPAPVLDLTQDAIAPPALDDDIVFENAEPAPSHAPAPPAQAYEEPAALEPSAPAPAPSYQAAPQRPVSMAPTTPAEPIISAPTAAAAAGSLHRLAGTLRINDTANQTIEGVVRELLKPMLKEWLDHNLPGIVEARVEAELERIARLAR